MTHFRDNILVGGFSAHSPNNFHFHLHKTDSGFHQHHYMLRHLSLRRRVVVYYLASCGADQINKKPVPLEVNDPCSAVSLIQWKQIWSLNVKQYVGESALICSSTEKGKAFQVK